MGALTCAFWQILFSSVRFLVLIKVKCVEGLLPGWISAFCLSEQTGWLWRCRLMIIAWCWGKVVADHNDGPQVRLGVSQGNLAVPGDPRRFDSCTAVLGKQIFTSGRHYWVVQVGNYTLQPPTIILLYFRPRENKGRVLVASPIGLVFLILYPVRRTSGWK